MDSCWAYLYWQLASLTRRIGRITDRVAASTLVPAEVSPRVQAGASPQDLEEVSQPDRVVDYQQDQAGAYPPDPVVACPQDLAVDCQLVLVEVSPQVQAGAYPRDRVAASPQDLAVGCRLDHVIRSSNSPASTVASGAGA